MAFPLALLKSTSDLMNGKVLDPSYLANDNHRITGVDRLSWPSGLRTVDQRFGNICRDGILHVRGVTLHW